LLVGLDVLVDFAGIGAVVGNRGLNEAERNLQIACGLRGVTTVVADHRYDLGHVLARPEQPGPAAGWAVGEPDQRMLIHAQALLDVALRESSRRQVNAAIR
jgi:hypothetical protein